MSNGETSTLNAQRSTPNAQVIGTGHHVRAVMELTGRNTAKLLSDLTAQDSTPVARIVGVGGAAKSDLWMRVVEETSGVAVAPARPADTAARGAAMFAATATGLCGSLEECAIRWSKGSGIRVQEDRVQVGSISLIWETER